MTASITTAVATPKLALLDHFSALEDPRQNAKVVFPLTEVMLVTLCGTIAGCDDLVEVCGPEAAAFGRPDSVKYENVSVPALIIAGAEDRLREPGYAQQVAARIRGSEVHVYERCGHCPNIEMSERFNAHVIDFLKRVHRAQPSR